VTVYVLSQNEEYSEGLTLGVYSTLHKAISAAYERRGDIGVTGSLKFRRFKYAPGQGIFASGTWGRDFSIEPFEVDADHA
jgi:hypothetical protein